MKIYIETVFFLNFMIDYMILLATKKILYRETNQLRLILGSILGSLTTITLYVSIRNIELILLKITLSILMNYISFGKKELFKNTIYFYMISIILGGSIYLIGFQRSYYGNMILLLISTPIIIHNFVKEYKKYKILQKETYKVIITISKKDYELDGFIDTGNQLKSPISHKPVILVNLICPKNKTILVPFKALNTEGIIECMKPDKVVINDKEIENCLIGFATHSLKIDGCNCILPMSLKEEL